LELDLALGWNLNSVLKLKSNVKMKSSLELDLELYSKSKLESELKSKLNLYSKLELELDEGRFSNSVGYWSFD